MRKQQDNERYFYLLIKSVFKKQGRDFNKCELCGQYMNKPNLHHTKYDNATINDIKIVCTKCNLKKENQNLI